MPRIFAYGTLLAGESNAHFLTKATYGGVDALWDSQLFNEGPYPYLVAGQGLVYGECYDVDAATFAALDELEDHPHTYRRQERQLLSGRIAWVYVGQLPTITALPAIPSGRWRWRDYPVDTLADGVFVYGSNLDPERLRQRAPSWDGRGIPALLPGFERCYRKVSVAYGVAATVLPQANSQTWGVIVQLTERDREALDRYEGITSQQYLRQWLTVRCTLHGKDSYVSVQTYVAHPDRLTEAQAPTPDYRAYIEQGLVYWGLF